MELKEFIKETLSQIADGLSEGDKYIKDKHRGSHGIKEQTRSIKFDVSVATNEENTTGIKGNIKVASVINIGGKGEKINASSNYSRIEFEVLLHVRT